MITLHKIFKVTNISPKNHASSWKITTHSIIKMIWVIRIKIINLMAHRNSLLHQCSIKLINNPKTITIISIVHHILKPLKPILLNLFIITFQDNFLTNKVTKFPQTSTNKNIIATTVQINILLIMINQQNQW